jgi:hypothetical protein
MASGALIRIVALASFSNPVTCDRSHVHNISRIIICYTYYYYFRRLHLFRSSFAGARAKDAVRRLAASDKVSFCRGLTHARNAA